MNTLVQMEPMQNLGHIQKKRLGNVGLEVKNKLSHTHTHTHRYEDTYIYILYAHTHTQKKATKKTAFFIVTHKKE